MTYKELLQQLQQLTEEQLNQDVAICSEDDEDEYYQASVELVFVTETDVLDKDHPVIRFWWELLHRSFWHPENWHTGGPGPPSDPL